MTFEIDILNDNGYPVDEARLRAAAETVLAAHDVEDGSALSILITTDDAVAAHNLQFRGIDKPTDVLSFPADEPPIDDEPLYIGDLMIAYDYSVHEAETEGNPVDDSFVLLVVHGTLHLLGYDHDTYERKAEMWAAQADALTALNVPLTVAPDLEDDEDEPVETDR
jgi:probable rRNA maturation factor